MLFKAPTTTQFFTCRTCRKCSFMLFFTRNFKLETRNRNSHREHREINCVKKEKNTEDTEKGKKAFTLVEIVVSITLLAIVFLSLYQFFFKSYSFSRDVHKREVALLLARKKAEHTLAGIEAEYDTVTVDTLNGIVYKTILKTNKEIPPSCSINVYVNKERILVIQMLKP
jgi:prepilin-type N-terminal cleavage/methylation domain-containing protein